MEGGGTRKKPRVLKEVYRSEAYGFLSSCFSHPPMSRLLVIKMKNLILQATVLALTLKIATGCGGYLVGSGNITSPNYPSHYPNNSSCTWILVANPGHYISLRLLYLDTEYQRDYVFVSHEGTTLEIKQCNYVNEFSGSSYINSGISKALFGGSNATVMFVSDSSNSASGFQLEYRSVNNNYFTDCGGYLVGSGNITSPNYRSFYPMKSRCTWTLAANPGEYISLRIVELDTEGSHDVIYIYNCTATSTDSSSCKLVQDYSGHSNSYSYELSSKTFVIGRSATVMFVSDSYISSSGFQLEYTSVNITLYADCGGHLVGSGNLTSPNYPNFYPANSRCSWTLSASVGYEISLRPIFVDMESSYDYVQIYNGSGLLIYDQDHLISSYSGRYGRYYNESSKGFVVGPNVTVVFFSDSSISASGFQMEYETVSAKLYTDCGGHLVGSGNITTPNYPSFYPGNCRCSWTLSAKDGYSISLRLIYVDTEYSYDYVYIYRGSAVESSNQDNHFSGHYQNFYYGSTKPLVLLPNVTIVFFSDSSISASGIQIEYQTINSTHFTDCGGVLLGSGSITSPNYPSFYPDNSRCTWTLSASTGYSVSLRLIALDTEYLYDYIHILDGTGSSNSYPYNYYTDGHDRCDLHRNMKTLVLLPNVTVAFFSDGSISASGFRIEYATIKTAPFLDCGGYLVGSGNISSPNYPQFYPDNCRCIWTLSASPGYLILLRMLNIDTESYIDEVYIYNGSAPVYSDVTLLNNTHIWSYFTRKYRPKRFSGEMYPSYYGIPKPLVLLPNSSVVFFSDSSISATGIQIEYQTISATPYTDCGGYLVGSGSITSPNYPRFYPSNSHCKWTLTARAGHYIMLRVVNVDTEYSYDYVYIYNGSAPTISNQNSHISSYSGRYSRNSGQSTKPLIFEARVTVVFISDSSISASGFKIEYETTNVTPYTDCGGYFVGSGTITSPNYPSFYPSNCRCKWTISASTDHLISLRLINFDTEYSYDYAYIYNGSVPIDSNLIIYFSGSNVSNSETTRKTASSFLEPRNYGATKPLIFPNVTIVFFSDSSISAPGFQIEYRTIISETFTDCGGYLIGSGRITSPNYPSFYPSNCRCTWTLSATTGSFILLRILTIDTEYSYDYVRIYNGSEPANYYWENYNRDLSGSGTYRSSKPLDFVPNVTVIFYSDSAIAASGFQIEYQTVNATPFTDCGGVIFAGSGFIRSPNYPSLYPGNCHCKWTITANSGFSVLLRPVNVDTEESFDYIYIYNGSENNRSDLNSRRYSGRFDNSYFITYNSKPVILMPNVTVVFFSDNSISSHGFQIEYSAIVESPFSGCGGYLIGSGSITSPNYPSYYPDNCRCTWTLSASAGTLISLLIIDIDMEYQSDYLYIHNGSATGKSSMSNIFTGRNGIYSVMRTKPLIFETNITVVFISDSSISAPGFKIDYETMSTDLFTGCGGYLVGSGKITSPNYPRSYPVNSRCTWTLNASAGNSISLSQIIVDTENPYDYVCIYNGSTASDSNLLRNYSGNFNYRLYQRSNNEGTKSLVLGPNVIVVFYSDYTISASGFEIEYVTITTKLFSDCGGYLVGSGYISSPNYPHAYPANSRCTWTLTASPGSFVSLSFIDIDTEDSYDSVSVYNGTIDWDCDSTYYMQRFAGQNDSKFYYYGVSKPLITGPIATVVFISDSTTSAAGFQMEYSSVTSPFDTDCGGNLVGTGRITSPNYPNYYPANSRCLWRIAASPGRYLLLRIEKVDTEDSYDYVLICNGTPIGEIERYHYLYRLSGKRSMDDFPQRYGEATIMLPSATVVFISDSARSATGFRIEYTSVKKPQVAGDVIPEIASVLCGGDVNGSGVILSPNYPQSYPHNLHCTWSLRSNPISSMLIVQFWQFQTEANYDIVNIYSENGTLRKYSGASLPPNFTLGSRGYIVFTSDWSSSAAGFNMTFTSIEINTAFIARRSRGVITAVLSVVITVLIASPRLFI